MTRITTKVLAIMAALSVAIFSFSVWRTWLSIEKHTDALTASQAELALQFDLAIRDYVGAKIRPLMERHLPKNEFIPEAMSTSYVARSVFDKVCQQFPEYIIKFSSDHPRNPRNAAEPEEAKIIRYFRDNPQASRWVGEVQMNGRKYFIHCIPRRTEQSCLHCHGQPEDAPASLVKKYGPKAGFHRSLGDVMALDMVGIPVDKITATMRSELKTQLAVLAGGVLALAIVFIGVFHRVVGRRLALITKHFQHAATQSEVATIESVEVSGHDEISMLAANFNSLAGRVRSLHDSLEQRVEDRTIALQAEIEERKRVEESLERAKEEAEAANRSKGEFLANMSHEIRTPMTAILGYIDVLADGCARKCPLSHSGIGDPIEVIRQNAQHLLQVIDDVLDLSKIEAGRMVLESTRCSPYEIVMEVVSLLKVRASAKGLKLEAAFDGLIPETIQSDSTRLRQILLNLAGNAIKFTEIGTVRIVTTLRDAEQGPPMLQIQVVDSGIGMTEETMSILFRPFSQADASTTRRFGGTGLGLTISSRLATMLGGDIQVRSALGQGTTFFLNLPTGPLGDVRRIDPSNEYPNGAGAEELTPASSHPALPAGCRLLLAEDGPDNQRWIGFILRKVGAAVVVVENGKQAVDVAMAAQRSGGKFDAVLMDMQMPEMDGYEATQRLRNANYNGPIIALTAHAMSGDRQKCLEVGCNDYVSKPINRAALLESVHRCIAEHRGGRFTESAGFAIKDGSLQRTGQWQATPTTNC